MKRLAILMLVGLAAALCLGAGKCSKEDNCATLRALADSACRLDDASFSCIQARQAIADQCSPKPTPTPTPATCPDGLPPGPDGCTTAPDPHKPGCAAEHLQAACWDQPPGQSWAWVCQDGTTRVEDPKLCPSTPPEHPPGPGDCTPLPGPGVCKAKPEDIPEGTAGEHDAAVNRAIDAACASAGLTCGQDGPPRPGAWDDFVARVAGSLKAEGLCVTYDYKSGDNGRASEMSVRAKDSSRVGNYQIETSAARVRRPAGAFRSVCEGGGEGQPIRPPTSDPGGPGKPPAAPALSKVLISSVGAGRIVLDATPKTCEDRDWCVAHSTGGACCPGGGEQDPNQRQAVEKLWGPWTWTIDGRECVSSGECWLDGGNPLRIVAPGAKGKTVRLTGGNGVFGEVTP